MDQIEELITALKESDKVCWRNAISKIERGDMQGIYEVLNSYGGMGSITDQGHDERVGGLLDRILVLATEIKNSRVLRQRMRELENYYKAL